MAARDGGATLARCLCYEIGHPRECPGLAFSVGGHRGPTDSPPRREAVGQAAISPGEHSPFPLQQRPEDNVKTLQFLAEGTVLPNSYQAGVDL